MPDEKVESEETTPVEEAKPAPTPDPAIAEMRAQLAAMNDTVTAALARRDIQPTGGGSPDGIAPQLRQALRNKGLSDAEISANAPLILPFVELFAPELIALVENRVGGVDERLTAKEMEDDPENYRYAKALRPEIKKVMADAKKDGRTMSREAAYHTAVSTNIEKVNQYDAQARAESRGADASALSGLGHRTSANVGRRAAGPAEPKSKAEIDAMTREERLKFYDQHGDTPLH